MDYITVKEAAEKWGVSPRRVQILCGQNRIKGAIRFGNRIMIPVDAAYPVQEKAEQSAAEVDQPLPRRTPFLYMSDLYSTPGTAEAVAGTLADNHEAQVLFEAEIAYSRGEIDKVYEHANYLLGKHSGFYAVVAAGMRLGLCAIWRGDLALWQKAKIHITEAPAKTDADRDILVFSLMALDSMLYDVSGFPDWFQIGRFEPLPGDSLPAAEVFYAKYLYAVGYAVATRQTELEGLQGLALMNLLPATIEPMIAQAKASRIIVTEMYLRLTCAAIYRAAGDDAQAVYHIDRAIALALPDKLYGLLAEYCRTQGSLLEQRLSMVDPEAWQEVKKRYKVYNEGWSKLSGTVRGKSIITTLSPKEREVAKLAAFGMSNAQIAEKLNLSLAMVKQSIRITSEKSGLPRDQFAAIL